MLNNAARFLDWSALVGVVLDYKWQLLIDGWLKKTLSLYTNSLISSRALPEYFGRALLDMAARNGVGLGESVDTVLSVVEVCRCSGD